MSDFQASEEYAMDTPAESSASPRRYKQNRVFWKRDEYIQLANELLRLYPQLDLFQSKTLAGVTLTDLNQAQKCLPMNRRRPGINSITPIRPKLLEAFEAIRATRPVEVEAPPPPPPPPPPPENPYEVVFRPLVNLFASAMMTQLEPFLRTLNPGAADQLTMLLQPPPGKPQKVAKPRIGLVGPQPHQYNELMREFPQFDFVCEADSRGGAVLSTMRSADRIIGMTNFMNHPTDGALARTFGDKYTRVTGGVSAIKRQIKLWINSGAI